MTEYQTIAGTEPSEDGVHEPRTIQRTNTDDTIYMMTEIEDGVFVQWSACDKCRHHASDCTCKDGPQLPSYIAEWRDKRFKNSLRNRKRPAPGFDKASVLAAAREAQNADNNDEEIDLLREALETALGALGLELPDPYDGDEAIHREDGSMAGDQPNEEGNIPIGQSEEEAPEPDESDTRQKVDDGLDSAVEAVRAAKKSEEDPNDVGF